MVAETVMKTDRIFALVAAGLITLVLAQVFAHEKVGVPQERTRTASVTDGATAAQSPGL